MDFRLTHVYILGVNHFEGKQLDMFVSQHNE